MQNVRLVFLPKPLNSHSMRIAKYLLPLVFLVPAPALAASATDAPKPLLKIVKPFTLKMPLDCTIGMDCWVLNYPDAGTPEDGKATDPSCLSQTYEDHKGTDIALPDKAAMDRGVNALAARDGIVKIVRDGEEDHFPLSPEQLAKIKADKKECGNAVLIDHGEGWQTMYCHLKRGSIVVKPKQQVKAGEKIAQVGASGMTQFPHLHIGVIRDKDVIDPFTGKNLNEAAARAANPCSKNRPEFFTSHSHS
jgi:murein DD-endopeptidase MepM/ murein hydrolase activator NlpD